MTVRIVTALVGSVISVGVSLAGQALPAPSIDSPTPGQTVEKKDVVTVRMAGAGQPVLAVRSKQPGSLWWIQNPAEASGPNLFDVSTRFGNESTRHGTRFEITALVAPDEAAATLLAPGASMKTLPSEWTHSKIREVVVGATATEGQTQTTEVELVMPKPAARIERLQKVVFRVPEAAEVAPVLLVRSSEPNSPWWVQQPLVAGEDQWEGTARIGNSTTPAGSTFYLMLVFPEDARAAEAMQPGATLRDVSQLMCSQKFTVTQQESRVEESDQSNLLSSVD